MITLQRVTSQCGKTPPCQARGKTTTPLLLILLSNDTRMPISSLGGVDGSRHNHAVGLKPTATFAAEGTASSAQQATALSPPGILLSSDDGDDDNNADVQPPLCEWQQRRSAGPTPAIRPARLIGPHSRRHLEPARLISWQAAASQSRRQACVTVAFGDRSAQVRIWTQSRCCNEFNQRTSDSQSVVTVCTQPVLKW